MVIKFNKLFLTTTIVAVALSNGNISEARQIADSKKETIANQIQLDGSVKLSLPIQVLKQSGQDACYESALFDNDQYEKFRFSSTSYSAYHTIIGSHETTTGRYRPESRERDDLIIAEFTLHRRYKRTITYQFRVISQDMIQLIKKSCHEQMSGWCEPKDDYYERVPC